MHTWHALHALRRFPAWRAAARAEAACHTPHPRSDKRGRAAPPRRKVPLSWEEELLANYMPPVYAPNRFVLAATSVLCFGLAIYSAWHVRH